MSTLLRTLLSSSFISSSEKLVLQFLSLSYKELEGELLSDGMLQVCGTCVSTGSKGARASHPEVCFQVVSWGLQGWVEVQGT